MKRVVYSFGTLPRQTMVASGFGGIAEVHGHMALTDSVANDP